jgi:hypothetical protein
MCRCLIVSCSRTKVASPEPMPAIQRYDGPAYRVLRKFLAEAPDASRSLDVYILSAEFGLIEAETKIPVYNRLMTASRAKELRPHVMDVVQHEISPQGYSEVFLSMSQLYLKAIDGIGCLLDSETKVIASNRTTGQSLTDLKKWLWRSSGSAETESAAPAPIVQPKAAPQTVILRGRQVKMSTAQTISQLKQGMDQNWDVAHKIQAWYLDLERERVSPKWAAQYLFDVPVNEFSADEARRVLRRLGLNCYKI